jgi:type IV pilus assembly protein PilF
MTRRILSGIAIAGVLLAGAGAAVAGADSAAEAARYNAQLGIAYLKQGKLEIARDKVERALSQNSRDAVVQTAAALLYDRLGDERRADRAYSAALRLDSRNPDMQNNYAVFQCRRGEHAKGEKLFEQAAKNPMYRTPAVAYANAGVCARGANDLARAEEYFRKALALQPTYPDALLQLADLAFARGNGLQARAFLERYFTSTPATPDALALGVRVERSLGDTAAANDYAARLKRDFPSSQQARDLAAVQGG